MTALADTIKGLEFVLADLTGRGYPRHREAVESALAHLRDREATIRECADQVAAVMRLAEYPRGTNANVALARAQSRVLKLLETK